MTSPTTDNLQPETDTARPSKKVLLAGHADSEEAQLVDEAVLQVRKATPKFKRAHAVVKATVAWATEVVGEERAKEILRRRRATDVAA